MIDVFQFPATDLPAKTKHGGYAYVIEFDGGLVKVGMTQDPQIRIASHVSHAGIFGVRPLRGWLSPLHEDPARTEGELIAVATGLGGKPTGREYFRGADFTKIVASAATFTYPPVDFEAAEQRGQEFRDALVRTFGGKSSPETLIAEVFGRIGDAYALPDLSGEAIPHDLIRLVAESLGASVAEVLEMDYVGIVEATNLARVKSEALKLRLHAASNGRADLLRPLREVRNDARQLQIVFPSEAA